MSGERIVRHNEIRDATYEMAAASNSTSSREVPHLLPGTDARPADIHMRRWTKGKDTAFDVTVINPLQIALVDRCAAEPGHALDVNRRRKMDQSWPLGSLQTGGARFHSSSGGDVWIMA